MSDESIPVWSPDYPLPVEAGVRAPGRGSRSGRIRHAVLMLVVCVAMSVVTGTGERLLAPPAEAHVAATSPAAGRAPERGGEPVGRDAAEPSLPAATAILPVAAARALVEAVEQAPSAPTAEVLGEADVPTDRQVPPAVAAAIRDACRAVQGADCAFLMTLAAKESGFDPKAKSKRSSAEGLYQFVANTWLHVVRTHGPKHGLSHWAAKIAPDKKGALTVRSPADRKAILALRRDPRINALMKAEHAAEENARLADALGRAPTPFELYAAHLMGVPAAAKAVKRGGIERAVVSQAAARANPSIFAADGRIRPAAAKGIERFVDAHMRRFARADASATPVKQAMASVAAAP